MTAGRCALVVLAAAVAAVAWAWATQRRRPPLAPGFDAQPYD